MTHPYILILASGREEEFMEQGYPFSIRDMT